MNVEKEISFADAFFGRALTCEEAIFEGEVTFRRVRCDGDGNFSGAQFKNPDKNINFFSASFGGDLDCAHAIFKGCVNFISVQCKGRGSFAGAQFKNPEKEIKFFSASFGGDLDCSHAIFEGGATFSSVQCKGEGIFLNSKFMNPKKEIVFHTAHFGTDLICLGTLFEGGANFSSVQCDGDGNFSSAQFKNPDKNINFFSAHFGTDLICQETLFEGGADFNSVQCDRNGYFLKTKFEEPDKVIVFDNVVFNRNLVFSNGVAFFGPVSFISAKTGVLKLEEPIFFLSNSLDLQGLQFSSFEGTKELGLKFVGSQRNDAFSREPYIQLENYYRNSGDETQANEVYLEGRSKLRKQALKKGTNIHWSRTKIGLDWFLDFSVKYGVRTWRLLFPIILLLVAGVGIYWQDNTLDSTNDPPTALPEFILEKILHRFLYVLDLLIPVNLNVAEQWQPANFWGIFCATVLIISGWILFPLLIAALSGVLKRE